MSMNVRTITLGVDAVSLHTLSDWTNCIREAATILTSLSTTINEILGLEVQTTRISTNPFGEWMMKGTWANVDEILNHIDQECSRFGIDLVSVGPALSIEDLDLVPTILDASGKFSCSALVQTVSSSSGTSFNVPHEEMIVKVSKTILNLPNLSKGGACFRFCVSANCLPHTPFFPVAYYKADEESSRSPKPSPMSLTFGLENSGVFVQALSSKTSGHLTLKEARETLLVSLNNALKPLDELAENFALKYGSSLVYRGIDTSLNPSLKEEYSIVNVFESVGVGNASVAFGGVGSLAVSAMLTGVLKSIDVKKTGFCGNMLPILEDRKVSIMTSSSHPRPFPAHPINISCSNSLFAVGRRCFNWCE